MLPEFPPGGREKQIGPTPRAPKKPCTSFGKHQDTRPMGCNVRKSYGQFTQIFAQNSRLVQEWDSTTVHLERGDIACRVQRKKSYLHHHWSWVRLEICPLWQGRLRVSHQQSIKERSCDGNKSSQADEGTSAHNSGTALGGNVALDQLPLHHVIYSECNCIQKSQKLETNQDLLLLRAVNKRVSLKASSKLLQQGKLFWWEETWQCLLHTRMCTCHKIKSTRMQTVILQEQALRSPIWYVPRRLITIRI